MEESKRRAAEKVAATPKNTPKKIEKISHTKNAQKGKVIEKKTTQESQLPVMQILALLGVFGLIGFKLMNQEDTH